MHWDACHAMGSHGPLLRMLGARLEVGAVLELGAGEFSTRSFLDTNLFPDLYKLVSVESDQAWMERVDTITSGDQRIFQSLVPDEKIVEWLTTTFLPDYDLIMVDNSMREQVREATIQCIASTDIGSALVLVHDIEYEPYRCAADGFDNVMVYESSIPSTSATGMSKTGVFWNDPSS